MDNSNTECFEKNDSMKKLQSRVGKQTYALLATIVILAAASAIAVSQANQISTLKESGRSYCASVNTAISDEYAIISNTTQTLRQQIANDSSMISILNATKPAGYEAMVATLNSQISQDQAIIASFPPETDLASAYCALVNQ
jgi:hypothetical protein